MPFPRFARHFIATLVLWTGTAPLPAHQWSFHDDTEGWGPYGTPPGLAPEETALFQSMVQWESTLTPPGSGGSLKIEDRLWNRARPYAISGPVPIDEGQAYRITGLTHGEGENAGVYPSIFLFFFGENETAMGGTTPQWNWSEAPEAPGWSRFEGELAPHQFKAGVTHVKLAIRPPVKPDQPEEKYPLWVGNLLIEKTGSHPLPLEPIANLDRHDPRVSNEKGEPLFQPSAASFTMLGEIGYRLIVARDPGTPSLLGLAAGDKTLAREATVPLPAGSHAGGDGVVDELHLLHTLVGKDASGAVGTVEFTYQDTSRASVEVIAGVHAALWKGASTSLPKALPATLPGTPSGTFQATAIANPHPEKEVQSVTLRAEKNGPLWVIAALATQKGASRFSATLAARRDLSHWKEFVPGIRKSRPEAVSLEFLLDAPAGKHGFVRVVNGHFVFENGRPARFWGTNLHADYTLFPTHEEAEQVADTLARYGCNIVRIHYPEKALIDRTRNDTREMVGDDLWERFEYLVFALKRKGIYLMIESIGGFGRKFKPGDGVRLPLSHGETYFAPSLQPLAQRFMEELLGRKNRYTGLSLANDPALVLVSVQNEQSIFRLTAAAQWSDEVRAEFQGQYNRWLLAQYRDRAGLAAAWNTGEGSTALRPEEDPAKGSVTFLESFPRGAGLLRKATQADAPPAERLRARSEVAFLKSLQEGQYRTFQEIGQRLGLKIPIIGTNIIQGFAEMDTLRPFGVSAQNMYWDHVKLTDGGFLSHNRPEFGVNPLMGRNRENEPVWINKAVEPIWLQKISGMATVTPENDAMWPNEWRASHLMMNGATAALQDADAFFQFAFGGGGGYRWETMKASRSIVAPTISYNDPATLSSFLSGAFLFLRGDVATSPNRISIQLDENAPFSTEERLRDGSFPTNYLPFVARYEFTFPGDQPGGPPSLVMSERGDASTADNLRLARSLDATLKERGLLARDRGLQEGRLVSDTGELVRDWQNELFLVNTPLSQGFTGFPARGVAIELADLTLRCESPFATLQLSSLDGAPLKDSRRMFLIAVARADNRKSEISFDRVRKMPSGALRGEGLFLNHTLGRNHAPVSPVLVEPVLATLELGGERFRLTPLGPDMVPLPDQSREFSARNGKAGIPLRADASFSVWYLLERIKP